MLILELTILYLLLPFIMFLPLVPYIVIPLIIAGIAYTIYVSFIREKMRPRLSIEGFKWTLVKIVLLRFLLVALASTVLMYFTDKESLFSFVRNKPLLWLMISLFYSFFSVFPQELFFRSYFFKRYEKLFGSNIIIMIVLNALLFAFAHLFFKSLFVLLLTFIGGIFFAWTYVKSRSLLLVTLEHILYGFWIFTLGAGGLLAFPTA